MGPETQKGSKISIKGAYTRLVPVELERMALLIILEGHELDFRAPIVTLTLGNLHTNPRVQMPD